MNYRKWIMALLVLILCLPVWTPKVKAASVQITIELDGETLNPDVPPYITRTNVTMVPAGVISQGLGAGVKWDQASKTATISKDNNVLQLTSGKTSAIVNGAAVRLDTSVQISQGRVMVPLRFVSEQLGLQVVWGSGYEAYFLIFRHGDRRAFYTCDADRSDSAYTNGTYAICAYPNGAVTNRTFHSWCQDREGDEGCLGIYRV